MASSAIVVNFPQPNDPPASAPFRTQWQTIKDAIAALEGALGSALNIVGSQAAVPVAPGAAAGDAWLIGPAGGPYEIYVWDGTAWVGPSPVGAPGTPGTPGAPGVSPTIAVGTVTSLAPGATPTSTLTGGPAYTWNLGIPQGQPGTGGSTLTVGTLSAAGTTQATATPLPAGDGTFTLINAGTGGVVWMTPAANQRKWVRNDTLNPVNVYPPSTGSINNQGNTMPISVPPDTTGAFVAVSATRLVTAP